LLPQRQFDCTGNSVRIHSEWRSFEHRNLL
jgi:hypothetical protein